MFSSVKGLSRIRVFAPLAAAALLSLAPPGQPQSQQPSLPLDDIIKHVAEKEVEYARAHALYRYRLTVRVQEVAEQDRVVGQFEQVGDVDFDPRGHRQLHLRENPRVDLLYLNIPRVELDDLEFVPLFILAPEDIPKYDITYLTRERIDEVDTYVFRLAPRQIVRFPEQLFEGVIWVDADKLDIVRALGRSLPARSGGVLGGYFQRVELFREPVDSSLFTTFVRADDVLSARQDNVRIRLTLRFSDHERARESAPPPNP